MKSVRDLHREAMALAFKASAHREDGDVDLARSLALQALALETEAASLVEKLIESEPTRSILYQSAASLAFQAGEVATAQRLAADALSGFPPPRIENELIQFLDDLKFESHLEVATDPLSNSEVQLSIAGDAVGSGRVEYKVLDRHLRALMGLIGRTTRRLVGEPYRRGGRSSAAARAFVPILSAARPGSFAITVEIAYRPDGQQALFATGEQIINEVVEGVNLIQNEEYDQLKMHIGIEQYYRSFLSQAQELAPDGEHVSLVGLTSSKQTVGLTQRKSEFPKVADMTPMLVKGVIEEPFENTIKGVLDEAISRGEGYVGVTAAKKVHHIWVPEGLDDMVRNYFDRMVEVRVRYQHGRNELVSCTGLEEG